MRRKHLIPLAAVAAVMAGCGNDVTRPADLDRVAAPGPFEDSRFAEAGVFVRTPSKWRSQAARSPQIVSISSGAAQVAIWRFPRTEPLPETKAQLESARDELVRAVKRRDKGFDVQSTRIVIKPGLRAVEIVGIGTTQGEKRRVRSLHAYGKKGEVLVDALAPVDQFERVDKETFGPLARSLRLSRPKPKTS